MPSEISLLLCHPEPAMTDAFRHRFQALPQVQIRTTTFENLPPHDCFVTAANSFGIMTAGIDAAVVHFFGRNIMTAVQQHILEHFLGEQPIGTAFILPTGNERIPFLTHAPTMRIPTSIDDTTNVYTATWAALVAVHAHNRSALRPIRTVAFPAFGTGFGQVPYDEAARQMAAAYAHYLNPPAALNWDIVIARHKAISYDGSRRAIRGA